MENRRADVYGPDDRLSDGPVSCTSAVIAMFAALDFEGRGPIEGDWANGVTGLRGMRVAIARDAGLSMISQYPDSARPAPLNPGR